MGFCFLMVMNFTFTNICAKICVSDTYLCKNAWRYTWLQRICYSHLANGARNGGISIRQWGLIMKKAPSDSPIWQLKKRRLLLPLSSLITKPIKLDLSKPHYQTHYRRQGCVIREKKTLQPPLRTPLQSTRLRN